MVEKTPLKVVSSTPSFKTVTPSPLRQPESKGEVVELALAESLDGEPAERFSADVSEIFLACRWEGVPEGTLVRSVWTFTGSEVRFSATDAQMAAGSEAIFSLEQPPQGWPVGDYRVELFLGAERCRTVSFSIFQPQPVKSAEHPGPVQLARQLVGQSTGDEEKARALYSWLTQNITYDTQAYFSGDYGDNSPETVLRRRSGVCSGYARLFKVMAEAVGLEAAVVVGFSKGYSFDANAPLKESDHAWNAVKIEGQWRLLDATWGAGYIDERRRFVRQVDPHWFLTDPEQFVFSHLPEDQKWQLLDQPLSAEDYRRRPRVKPLLFDYELKLVSHPEALIEAEEQLQVVVEAGQPCGLMAALEREGEKLEGYTLVSRLESRFQVDVSLPQPGRYRLLLFASEPGAERAGLALSYDLLCSSGGGEPFPDTFQDYSRRQARLIAPRSRRLQSGLNRFALVVPEADLVYVQSDNQQWPLELREGVWEGEADLSGLAQVYAGFEGKSQTEGLLDYEVE